MKRLKYLFYVLILFLLLNFYQNYIFYRIPYNPLAELSTDIPTKFYLNLNGPNGVTLSKSSYNLDDNTLIFDYFEKLNLIPLKEKRHRDEIYKHDTESYYSCGFRFGDLKYSFVYITEVYLDDLTVLSIRSDIPKFKNGYYKIIDSKFDYEYINSILNSSQWRGC